MASATEIVDAFAQQIARLSVDDWKRVDGTTPLGHGWVSSLIDSKRWQSPFPWQSEGLKVLVDDMLEDGKRDPQKFGSHSYHRLNTALNAIWGRENLDNDSFVAAYGPFLPLIPPSSIGIDDQVAELWDPSLRRQIVERYADLLKTLRGKQTAADAHLTDDASRISLALCLEAIGASEARRAELEEMYVALCAFPSAAAPAAGKDADPIRACQNARLRWLGYENVSSADADLTIGTGGVHAVAIEDARVKEVLLIGGFTPSAVVLVAALVATGLNPGLLGLIAPLLAGAAGSVVGPAAYSLLSRRSKYGSAQRKLAFAISVALILGITAASVYLYGWVIPR